MQSREFKKLAIAAYKEKKIVAGIYAIRCKAIESLWVGKALNLSTIWNRLTFELRLGNCRCRSLQQAWNTYGSDSFILEQIEQVDTEKLSFAADRVMEERLVHWATALSANRLE
jgi:hypothetical protein